MAKWDRKIEWIICGLRPLYYLKLLMKSVIFIDYSVYDSISYLIFILVFWSFIVIPWPMLELYQESLS